MLSVVRVLVNGEERHVQDGATVQTLLEILRLEGQPIAVELNRRIIPQPSYRETLLQDGDTIEVVTFVGGG